MSSTCDFQLTSSICGFQLRGSTCGFQLSSTANFGSLVAKLQSHDQQMPYSTVKNTLVKKEGGFQLYIGVTWFGSKDIGFRWGSGYLLEAPNAILLRLFRPVASECGSENDLHCLPPDRRFQASPERSG